MRLLKKILLLLVVSFSLLQAGDFLMPNEAFKPYASMNAQGKIQAGVKIGQDIYLYEDKLTFKLKDANGISLGKISAPKSVDHHESKVYLESPKFVISLNTDKKLSGIQKITLILSYQGCSEMGLCYEPSSKEFSLEVDTALLSTGTSLVEKEESSKTDMIADTLKNGNIFIVLLTFFGFGLLLAMTPCVFPMIPIISGLIISQGENITTKKAFALSIVYVLAMAVAYTIAGVLAGLFGANIQAALQTPWVIYSFSFIFVALAFSMFGFYELKLPDSFVTKVSSKGSNSGGFIGVAIMGFLSALIVGPCVAAPLAGALVYIGQTGDAVFGGMALFSMSIGMGIPLIIVGVSAGKFMPKPGAWMTMVSAVFGVMMLLVAIWMLEKIIDPSITMILYSILGISFSLFLGVFDKDGHFFKHSVAMIIFIYSISLFIGFLAGASSLTQPLGFLQQKTFVSGVQGEVAQKAEFKVVKSIDALNVLLEKNRGKKILLDFSAEWCTACKELEEITFADAKVQAKMNEFILIRADVTENTAQEKALSKKYGVFGPPVIIFFDAQLHVKKSKTIVGFIEPAEFLQHLNSL